VRRVWGLRGGLCVGFIGTVPYLHVSIRCCLVWRMGWLTRSDSNGFCRSVLSDGSDMLELEYPGESNLVFTPRGNWNDRVFSYHCLSSAEAKIWKASLE
jgi:hypothetical protein